MYAYGAVFAEVGVDARLGLVRVRRMLGDFDAGRIISPKPADSQAIGAMTGGIGMALPEHTVTDHRDGRIVGASAAPSFPLGSGDDARAAEPGRAARAGHVPAWHGHLRDGHVFPSAPGQLCTTSASPAGEPASIQRGSRAGDSSSSTTMKAAPTRPARSLSGDTSIRRS